MINWVYDDKTNNYLYYYCGYVIAIIYRRKYYFFLELLPSFIHDRIVLHYKDKENVFNEANQYLDDVIRDTIDKFIFLNKYGVDYYFKLQDFIRECNYMNADKSALNELIKDQINKEVK